MLSYDDTFLFIISIHNPYAQFVSCQEKYVEVVFVCKQRVTLVAKSQQHCVQCQCAIKNGDALAVYSFLSFFGETFAMSLKAIKISFLFVTKHRAERVEN